MTEDSKHPPEDPETEQATPSWRRKTADAPTDATRPVEPAVDSTDDPGEPFDQTLINSEQAEAGFDGKTEALDPDLVGDFAIGADTLVVSPDAKGSVGPQIQDVVLVREIGRGGMGVVYEGRQDYLDRRVAVKVLSHARGGDEFTLRFQREAKILASLGHPNIVGCYQAGVSEDGHGYLVMEFVDGPTLGDWIAENAPLEAAEAVRVCRKVAEALEYAYRSGIIHRDVKPPNILLKHAPGSSEAFPFEPLLADLGLARASGEFSANSDLGLQEVTVQGTMMGSPPTMAPEQFDDPDSVDFRTDIYGLGCVLYHCLTGKLAFPQGTLTSLIARKTQQAPPDPRKLEKGVPAETAALVRDMMRRKASDRPASYEELLQRMDNLSTAAPLPVPTQRFTRPQIAAGALVLVLGTWALLSQLGDDEVSSGSDDPQSDLAELEPGGGAALGADALDLVNVDATDLDEETRVPSDEGEGNDETADATPLQEDKFADAESDPIIEPEPPRLVLPELAAIGPGESLSLIGKEFGEPPLAGWIGDSGGTDVWSALDDGHGAQALIFEGKSAAQIELPAPPWVMTGSFELKRPGGRSKPKFSIALRLEKGTGVSIGQSCNGDEVFLRGEVVQFSDDGGFEPVEELPKLGLDSIDVAAYRDFAPFSFRLAWDGDELLLSWSNSKGEERVETWSADELIPWGAPVGLGLQLQNGAALLRDLVVVGG